MSDEKELTVLTARPQLTPSVWQMIERVAPAMHMARLFKTSSPEQAMAIMLKGYELGLGLTASFEFVQVVEGRPALSPRGMLALIQAHPECAGIKIEDIKDGQGKPQACRVTMKRRNGFEYTVEWNMADAERAGVIKPGSGWEKYPANMLRWRAIGFCADVVFGDVIGGLKRADELGADLTPDGDVIEGSWSDLPPAPVQPVQQGADTLSQSTQGTAPTLAELTERYDPAAIMAANDGKIPGSEDELRAVAEKLAANNA